MLRTFCVCFAGIVAVSLALNSGGRKIANFDSSDLQHYTYADFVDDFQRKLTPGGREWSMREDHFQTNLQKVMELRRIQGMKWLPGVTKFMDYFDHEYNLLLGYKGRRSRTNFANAMGKQSVDNGIRNVFQIDPELSEPMKQGHSDDFMSEDLVPATYNVIVSNNLNKTVVSALHDQGACGSCWADAALTALEGVVEKDYRLMEAIRKAKHQPLLSRDYAISCTHNSMHCGGTGGCNGATSELAFNLARNFGIPLAENWPSGMEGQSGVVLAAQSGSAEACPEEVPKPKIRVTGYTVLPQNAPRLRSALISQGAPLAVAVDATGWVYYKSGIYSDTDHGKPGEFTVNHMVALMGFEMRKQPHRYYLIKNSWGKDFGEDGYIRLEIKDHEQEHCGWDTQAHMGIACDGDPDKVWVCGTCGILFDASFPTGAFLQE